MGKKKQRKGADFDDDEFPEPDSEVLEAAPDAQAPAAANKKQNKSKKGKKVNLRCLCAAQTPLCCMCYML